MDDEDDDIFHDLLHDKKGKSVKPTVNSASKEENINDFPFKLNFSVDPAFSHSSSHAELEGKIFESIYSQGSTVLDHCKDANFLFVLVDNNDLAVVQVYHLADSNVQQKKTSTLLPTSLKSLLFKDVEKPLVRHLYIIQGIDSFDTPVGSPVTVYPGNIHLPTSSFASIFGKPTALMKSLVILLCTNNGCVFWRSFKSLRGDKSFSMMCQLHGFVNSILSVPMRKRSDVDEDVNIALQTALTSDSERSSESYGEMNGLLTVSDIGECCLMMPMTRRDKSNCESLPVRFCLPHPVVCCAERENQIIYSTGSSVEAASLTLKHDGNQPTILLDKCVTLMNAKIVRLSFRTFPKEPDTHLMGLTSDLDIIPIPKASSHSSSASTTSTHLPDTLQRIHQHSASIEALQKKSNTLDSCLLQLNIFARLYHQYQNTVSLSTQENLTNNDKNCEPLIHCECHLDHSQGYRKSSEVRIKMRNDSKIDLSHQWSVLITALPESSLSNARHCSETFCFELKRGFDSGSKKTFSVSLPTSIMSDHLAQLRIKVCLFLSLKQYSYESLSWTLTNIKPHNQLEVEIHQQVFSSLDFLCVSSDDDLTFSKVIGDNSTEEVRNFFDRLSHRKVKKRKEQSLVFEQRQNFEVNIFMPEVDDQNSRSDQKEGVFEVLLHNINHFPQGKDPLLCKSLDGTEISFTLEKIEPQPEERVHKLQMRLQSTDIILLSNVHCALVERLKEMIKRGPDITGTKLELERQVSALKTIRSCLSKTKSGNQEDDTVSILCEALDCLGRCLIK